MEAAPTTIDELTIARDGDDRFAPRRELKKQVLSEGAWPTVLYEFEELKRTKKGESWGEPKLALVRYRKLKGSLKFQKEFALNKEIAAVLGQALREWLAD